MGAVVDFKIKGLNVIELIIHNYLIIWSMVLFVASFVFYFLALRMIPLSIAYPVAIITSFLIINAFAYFYLGESINSWQLVGYILIIMGIILVFYYAEGIF